MLAARDEAYSESLRRNAETAAEQLQSQASAHEAALAKAQAGLEREQQLREKDAEVRPSPPQPAYPPYAFVALCAVFSALSTRQAARKRTEQLKREHAKKVRIARVRARGGSDRVCVRLAQLKSELEKATAAHRAALDAAQKRWDAQLERDDTVRHARAAPRDKPARANRLCRPFQPPRLSVHQRVIIFGFASARWPAHLVRPVHPWRTPTSPRARAPPGGSRGSSSVRSRASPHRDLGDGRPERRAHHGQRLPRSRARVRERARCFAADRRGAGSTRRPDRGVRRSTVARPRGGGGRPSTVRWRELPHALALRTSHPYPRQAGNARARM